MDAFHEAGHLAIIAHHDKLLSLSLKRGLRSRRMLLFVMIFFCCFIIFNISKAIALTEVIITVQNNLKFFTANDIIANKNSTKSL